MASEDTYAEQILRHIGREGYRPQKTRSLAKGMGIADDDYGRFRESVKELARNGRVVLGGGQTVTLPEPTGRINGVYHGHAAGFGFVTPDTPFSHGDLYIPRGESMGAVTGDRVVATVRKQGKRDGKMLFAGRIVEIAQRGRNRFVGELIQDRSRWWVRADGNMIHSPIVVDDPTAKNARPGDQVVVEMLRFPAEGVDARGVIVEVLGARGSPGVDTLSIVRQFQLPEAFPGGVLDAAHTAAAGYHADSAVPGREDLTALTVITIDPDDARDFDDAITLTTNTDGLRELGVHIADVSFFVTEGDPIDLEARERATSVYLPRHVIPMLPETLSNGVCSLQEGEPRLTKSAFITYDDSGRVVSERFANSMIRSTKRLTYRQASEILSGKSGGNRREVVNLLRAMETLARDIRKRRLKAGMLVLDLPDTELVFDDAGRVTDVQPADTSFSHTLIEMFMVEANEAVARLLAGHNIPNLRRIHPPPDDDALQSLRRFVAAMGIEPPDSLEHRVLQKLLDGVRGSPSAFAVHLAVLKSMESAEYAPAREGHFALASDDYVHFTSPIRRYPDLTIHRLLNGLLESSSTGRRRPKPANELDELKSLGRHCTANERRAESAERELRLWKILQLLSDKVGEEFDGIVTGVANIGVFVQLGRYLIDGLVRFDTLGDDWWDVDKEGGFVVGERSGVRIGIGDEVKVRIAKIDEASRKMDLSLVDHHPRRPIGATARQPRRAGRGSRQVKSKSNAKTSRLKRRRG